MKKLVKRTFSQLLTLCAVFGAGASTAHADDTLYQILCDCDPTIHSEAVLEIGTQVTPHSKDYGSHDGYEPGDVVIIQDSGGTAGRWKYNANGTWSDDSSSGFACSGFDTCVDLTGGNLPSPPYEVPAPPNSPNAHAVQSHCEANLVAVFSNTWWAASGPHTQDFVVERKQGSSWNPYYGGESDCVVYNSDVDTDFRVKGVNGAGYSGWYYYTANVQCSGGPSN